MSGRPLDASWKGWLAENLQRDGDPGELARILLANGFSLDAIRESMGARFPANAGDRRLDDTWKAWLRENLERGCDPDDLLRILLGRGFSAESIHESMGERFPGAPAAHRADPPLVRGAHPGLRRVETEKLQLYVLDGLLSQEECDGLIALINGQLRPSTITFGEADFRTSRTCDLSLIPDPRVAALDEKISRTLGIRRAYAEANQGQRYDVGQEFRPHTDFFEPGTDEYRQHAGERGNRTWTFMVYLNEGMEGGGTRFLSIDREFQPVRGQALLWNNLRPDGSPNHDTLHCGMPVTRGYKVVVTQWFRERGAGPMYYDE